jgi:hypothetical protein
MARRVPIATEQLTVTVERCDDSTPDWDRVLDDLEASCEVAEHLLVDNPRFPEVNAIEPRQWYPPQGLGPMPGGLTQRAMMILRRIAEVEQALADRSVLAARRISTVNRSDPRRRSPSPTRVDASY